MHPQHLRRSVERRVDLEGGWLTKNNIGFCRFFFDDITVVEPANHHAHIRIRSSHFASLLLRADQCRVFVVWVCLVNSIEGIAGNVASDASASKPVNLSYTELSATSKLT